MPVVQYRPEVAEDLRDAAGWYDDKRAGLGDDFLTEFWAAIDAVTDRPPSMAITSMGLRACRLSRFPYVIHFRYDDDEIVVFAVMFGGRDTSAWIDRV
jgi:hypothetical protein